MEMGLEMEMERGWFIARVGRCLCMLGRGSCDEWNWSWDWDWDWDRDWDNDEDEDVNGRRRGGWRLNGRARAEGC